MDKLLIIDGNAILHRAYHAYPPLTNTNGEIVNAVYGFFTLLFRVLEDQTPKYLALCFDRPGPTIRQSLYVGYHANRTELPEDFVPQIVMVHKLLEVMRVAMFSVDGYEGDDVIGTIVSNALSSSDVGPATSHPRPTSSSSIAGARQGTPSRVTHSLENALEIVILTGDRDLLQLVNPHVRVLMPLVGMTKTAFYDEEKVEEKYGVKSSQFVDYKALIGDASDGYPGVNGIGPKTASKLIQQYGTFDNLYAHIGELPEKLATKLATDAEQAALAKKLATIMTDVPFPFELTSCACSRFDSASLRKEFIGQGFKTLTARLDNLFRPSENAQEQLGLL